MKKAMTITYEVGGNLYLNITNAVPVPARSASARSATALRL